MRRNVLHLYVENACNSNRTLAAGAGPTTKKKSRHRGSKVPPKPTEQTAALSVSSGEGTPSLSGVESTDDRSETDHSSDDDDQASGSASDQDASRPPTPQAHTNLHL